MSVVCKIRAAVELIGWIACHKGVITMFFKISMGVNVEYFIEHQVFRNFSGFALIMQSLFST
jgi:hypothetical protein